MTLAFVIGIIPSNIVKGETSSAPKFESLEADDNPVGNQISFSNGTIISVEYSVDRYAGIDGVLIIGQGSNLTEIVENALSLNFSTSFEDRSYYKGSFNLTENTYFKGYSYVGLETNGTEEEVEIFNHLGSWHYLYVSDNEGEILPPEMYTKPVNTSNADKQGVYYTHTDQEITFYYKIHNGDENDSVTLVLSTHKEKITNGILTEFDEDVTFIQMEYDNFTDTSSGDPIFQHTLNFTYRTLYFTANNSYGWDSWSDDGLTTNINIYEINNGFYFESEPSIVDQKYTDIDNVEFTIKAYNSTINETYGISYYVVESADNDTRIVEWTEINGTFTTEYNETVTEDYNTTVREYNCSIGIYNANNIIYYESYNIYSNEYYNETSGSFHTLFIYDSRPQLSLHPYDQAYTNNPSVTFTYEIELVRGNITEILLDFGDGSLSANLTDDEDNSTTHEYSASTNSYNITLTVTCSLGTNNTITHLLTLDIENPVVNIISPTTNSTVSYNGYVEMYFDWDDDLGIRKVWVDWGDGTVWNATGDNFASHIYAYNGTYEATIMVEDLAGNMSNKTIIFSIIIEISIYSEPTPFATFTVITAISLIAYFGNKKRRDN